MTYIIKKLEQDVYLTDNFLGKGVLTDKRKDWTKKIDNAITFDNKPERTLKGLDLVMDCRIEEK